MTREEVYRIWANPASPWSDWVAPVPFSVLGPAEPSDIDLDDMPVPWAGNLQADTAVVLDLPAAEALRMAVALARVGFTPVPIFNATPNPGVGYIGEPSPGAVLPAAIDVKRIADALLAGAPVLAALARPEQSAPVFVLDSNRLLGQFRSLTEEIFDNRWAVFPEDFPAASYLISHDIGRVLLVQSNRLQPQGDVTHVLLRWQEAGLEVLSTDTTSPSAPQKIIVRSPSVFKAAWYRIMARFGFRRAAAGGLGFLLPSGRAAG